MTSIKRLLSSIAFSYVVCLQLPGFYTGLILAIFDLEIENPGMRYLLFSFCFLSFCTSAGAQQFNNLNFLQKCDTSKTGLCYWDLSWGKKESVKPDMID